MRLLRSTEKVLRWVRPPTLQVGFAFFTTAILHHTPLFVASCRLPCPTAATAHARMNAIQEGTSNLLLPGWRFQFLAPGLTIVLPCSIHAGYNRAP